ncbi:hypothetical protein [Sporocytophaga sp.]|uniref:WD40/YVTN/BNR-like repeat-containing protein n=1 Tax=Sporocytophaga sp. TaxID=2231183 RepID=UPI0025EAF27E|nr:hypothetical protein [Sporocytophaga sp.]
MIQGESAETLFLLGYGVGVNHVMYKSNDNGASWNLANINYDADLSLISDLKCHNKSLYMAYVGGVLKSDDGGENWESISVNLPAGSLGHLHLEGRKFILGHMDMESGKHLLHL